MSAISVISQLIVRADVDQACGKKNDSSGHHMSVINSTARVFPNIIEIEAIALNEQRLIPSPGDWTKCGGSGSFHNTDT